MNTTVSPDRDIEWREVWYGVGGPLDLAVVLKFKDDDQIAVYSVIEERVWLASADYLSIRKDLLEDEYSQILGRETEEA